MSADREKAEEWASRIKYSNYFPLEDCDLADAHLAGQESRQEEIAALREQIKALEGLISGAIQHSWTPDDYEKFWLAAGKERL